MKIEPIAKDSLFIAKLKTGTEFRRKLVDDGHRKRNAADELCDSTDLLCGLVNHCFWVSIHVEEGRAVRGTLCICSPDQAPRSRAFHEPIDVSVKNLIALLTASPETSLAVQANGSGTEIWGVLDAMPMFTLRLRVAGTGTVVASSGRSNVLAVLERGEVFVPKSAGEVDWVVIVANALDKAKQFPDRLKLAARFQRVVTAMHRQGHGGALVVVPSSTDSWLKQLTFAFRFDDLGSAAIRQNIADLEEAEKRHDDLETRSGSSDETPHSLLPLFAESVTAHRNLLDTLLRSIGDLSAIDGAVVIDEELKVHGFGAKLHVSAEPFQVIILDALTGETRSVPCDEIGGTRHQSAARFVFQNHEAMVFVASQDGRLTLFAWVIDRAEVAAVRRLEHFVWECRP